MLTLLTFPGSFDMPSHSPFCVKAMGLLNMAGVSWRAEYLDDPRKMPLGQLPVLADAERLIPDSAHIQAYLEAEGADFWPGLSAQDIARGQAMMGLVEGNLHLLLIYERWINEANWEIVRDVFFKNIPRPMRKLVTRGIRKNVARGLHGQGFARFSEADRVERARLDLQAIMTQLGDGPFLIGERPTAADTIVAPMLDMLMRLPTDSAARRMVRQTPGVAAYTLACRNAFYEAAPKQVVSAAA